jgi:hypothetical protein
MKNRKKSPAIAKSKTFIKNLKKWPTWKKTIALICLSAILIFGLANFYEFGRQKAWWGYSDEAIFLRHHEIFRWRDENLSRSTVDHPPTQDIFNVVNRLSQRSGTNSTLTLYAKKDRFNELRDSFLKYLDNSGWKKETEYGERFTLRGEKFNLQMEILFINKLENSRIYCVIYAIHNLTGEK